MTTTQLWWRLPTWRWLYSVPLQRRSALKKLTIDSDTFAPYLLPGDVVAIDRKRLAVRGDLVAVLVSFDAPGIRWTLGDTVFAPGESLALLQLRRDAQGAPRLCTRFGSTYAHHHRIIGVAVMAHRRPNWRWRCLSAPLSELRAKVSV